jgi:adenylate kinase family enzyme
MKIRIIGYAGSGKTSLTIKLQEKYIIQGISLDDFLKIKDKEQRMTALNKRLDGLDSWIIEGVQVSPWTTRSFHDADLIVVLDYPLYITQFRVFKRTCSQVFDSMRNWTQKRKTVKRMFKLFKWNSRFKKRLPSIKGSLYNQSAKVMILESPQSEKRLHQYIKKQLRLEKHKEERRRSMYQN